LVPDAKRFAVPGLELRGAAWQLQVRPLLQANPLRQRQNAAERFPAF
jgi:hypothetical protein